MNEDDSGEKTFVITRYNHKCLFCLICFIIISRVKKERNMLDRKMAITDIVENYPETFEVFLSHGMHCIGCMAAEFESVEEGALAHGIDVEELMQDLNDIISD